jgi:tetratricopeptide (TPR) repeat protein
VGHYLVLAVAPLDLSAHYGWLGGVLPPSLRDPLVWVGVLAAGVSFEVGVRAYRRRDRTTGLFLLATWLPLAPFLGVVPIGTLFAERHAYHALAGVALLLAWGGTALLGARARTGAVAAVAGLLLVWGVGLGARGWLRVPAWQSGVALWTVELEAYPESAFAAVSLAQEHETAGRIRPARRAAERALELGGQLDAAHLVLGNLALREGRPGLALPHYEQAALSPVRRFDARLGLALAQVELGDLAAAQALYEELAAERPHDLMVRRIGSELAHARRSKAPSRRPTSAPGSPRRGAPGSR